MKIEKYKGSFAKKIIAVWVLVLVSVTFAIAQTDNNPMTIERMALRWSDFTKKETSANSVMKAMTVANITMDMSARQEQNITKLTITLSINHDRNKSWVSKGFLRRSRDEETMGLLHHERIHLAINYLGMYKMYQELSEEEFTDDYKAEATAIFRRINLDTELRQIQYDSETMHSLRVDDQARWHQMINDELSSTYKTDADMKDVYTITKTIIKQ